MKHNSPQTVALSLISHTNVGKTTLARTLLRRDIGEVRDEAHVTSTAEKHCLIESPAGDRLELWDTPGFGDSVRLAKRLAQADSPIGWFMGEVWDRLRNRAFWSSQRAIRNILEQADVVLYLVNAAQTPEDSGYLDAELQVLQLLGKPVIVLLNQLGRPQEPAQAQAELQRWRDRLRTNACVHEVLALDAFARCWVQESTLLHAVEPLLKQDLRAAFAGLCAAWDARNHAIWRDAMAVLADRLVRAAQDREVVSESGWSSRLKNVGASLGLRREGSETAREQAMRRLAERVDADTRSSTDRLIQLHGLGGHATDLVLNRLAEQYAVQEPASEGKAAMLGGLVTGALAGLKADILSGGMTMGGGMLTGGVLGAIGAAGLARGYNMVRGVDAPTLAWTEPVLDELTKSALLGYLAVAHFGRGRGDWTAAEHPSFWLDHVNTVIDARRDPLHELWSQRDAATSNQTKALAHSLQLILCDACEELLGQLYPDAQGLQSTQEPYQNALDETDLR